MVGISDFRLPVLTSDENVRAAVEEFDLTKPENFIRFLVETADASPEAICNGINDLKEENLMVWVTTIRTQKRQCLLQLEKQNENFNSILEKLDEVSDQLESKIRMYVATIQDIDNLSDWEFFVKSARLRQTIKATISLAKIAVDAYMRANKLYRIVAAQCNANDSLRVEAYENFMDCYLLENGICRLMYDYDINKKDEFWLKIDDLQKQVYLITEIVNELKDDFVEDNVEDFDENNIDFS